jgi:hypothetical protein
MTLFHDILVIVLGWAIPLFLAWMLAKVPVIRDWIVQHQFSTGVALSCLISALISTTAVIIYDRYVLSAELEAFRAQFSGDVAGQITKISADSAAKIASLHQWVAGPPPTAKALCPPGQYVVGINHEDEGGLEHGAIYGMSVVCRPLNVP